MATWDYGFGVFSTYVEVILDILHNFISVACFLHVCGGDPRLLIALNL